MHLNFAWKNFIYSFNSSHFAENSTKLLAIAWHRSTSSGPSCQSLVTSSSKSSSALTETKNDLLDSYEGMDSGSHSLTLERLYAWEKKLYDEVKVHCQIIIYQCLKNNLFVHFCVFFIFKFLAYFAGWRQYAENI